MPQLYPSLPVSPRTSVFRAIVQILRADKTVNTIFKIGALRSWSGDSPDNIPFTFSQSAALRLTPTNGEEKFTFPNAMIGDLYINAELLVPGMCVDDGLNIWWALERAIYPVNNQQVNIPTLQAAGAHSGLVLFSQPAFDPEPSDKFLACTGQMKVAVRLNFN